MLLRFGYPHRPGSNLSGLADRAPIELAALEFGDQDSCPTDPARLAGPPVHVCPRTIRRVRRRPVVVLRTYHVDAPTPHPDLHEGHEVGPECIEFATENTLSGTHRVDARPEQDFGPIHVA